MIRFTLEAAKYEVGEAKDGPEALQLYGAEDNWDCVILDQRMPGMDGLETLARLKDRHPNARVIMATAYASIELAVEAMKAGATDFVRKPLTPETLRNAVAAAITRANRPIPERPEAALAPAPPKPIETITMNGFSILDSAEDQSSHPGQRRFVVVNPTGSLHEVVVTIDEEVRGYVKRITQRDLPVQSSFWTSQARRLLGSYLWDHGEVPAMKLLTLREIDRNDLLVAERWVET